MTKLPGLLGPIAREENAIDPSGYACSVSSY